MKKFILLLTLSLSCFAQTYTFLPDNYDKELDLEAQIIYKIADSSVSEPIKLFIPNITPDEKRAFSKYFEMVATCEASNFIYIKNSERLDNKCYKHKSLFFTNNYMKLLSDNRFYGAFFWNKSRPNIVFIKKRLQEDNIKLPASYEKYVEDF